MPAPTTYEIGVNLAGIATLASQDLPEPEYTFDDNTEVVKLGSGLSRGLGLPRVEWHYGFLYKNQYDGFKSICSGVSSTACISTLNNEMEFLRYNCNMVMPVRHAIRSPEGKQVYMDVTIIFSELVTAE